MKRTIVVLAMAMTGPVVAAAPAFAQPISEPASCQGYLASYANPNYAFIVHEIVKPTAADLGVTQGALLSGFAFEHLGGLEPCIP
jgi:hypothetical protein